MSLRKRYWLKNSIRTKPISAIYVDGDSKQYMVKRFLVETSTADKEFGFISETIGSRLVVATTSETPEVELEVVKGKDKEKSQRNYKPGRCYRCKRMESAWQ